MQPSYPTTQLQPPWGSRPSPQQQSQQQAPPQQLGQQPTQQGPTSAQFPGQQLPGQQQPQQGQMQGQLPGQQQPAYSQQPTPAQLQGQPGQLQAAPIGGQQTPFGTFGQQQPGQPGQQQPIQQPGFAGQLAQQPGTTAGGIPPATPIQQPFQQQPWMASGAAGTGQFAGQPAPGGAGGLSMQQQSVPSQQPRPSPGAMQQPELGPGAAAQPLGPEEELLATSPLVDVLDSPEAITVYVDLPGCDEEDIQLKAVGNTLHISATRPEMGDEDDRPLQRERLGRIERTITLPVPINVEEAEASCEEGVCTIELPKSEESRQKSIAFQ